VLTRTVRDDLAEHDRERRANVEALWPRAGVASSVGDSSFAGPGAVFSRIDVEAEHHPAVDRMLKSRLETAGGLLASLVAAQVHGSGT
jgi:hypothetical protein